MPSSSLFFLRPYVRYIYIRSRPGPSASVRPPPLPRHPFQFLDRTLDQGRPPLRGLLLDVLFERWHSVSVLFFHPVGPPKKPGSLGFWPLIPQALC